MSVTGEELVPVAVEGIYTIRGIEDENSKYFMLYNGEELNVIERLIKAGLIDENNKDNKEVESENNTAINTIINTVNNELENIN